MPIDDAAAENTPAPAALAAAAHADRASRVLIAAFVLALCLIGWLGISGVDATAFADGLFGLSPGGCGGG
jgi:hypothetical protein